MKLGFHRENEETVERSLELDPVLAETLKDFRQSVHGWSDEAMARPRTVAAMRRSLWRLAAGWALGAVLAVGAFSGGFYERQHLQTQARLAAAQESERMRLEAEQRAREEEDLLAMVDSEVSRQTPRAMEPLVQLMEEGENSQ